MSLDVQKASRMWLLVREESGRALSTRVSQNLCAGFRLYEVAVVACLREWMLISC